MVVMVPEGFNSNGARALFQGNNNYLLYARELLGLPSSNSVFLQEMISSITWALETFPQVNPGRIGAAGYSYGGGMSVELAQFDSRVRSISVPATNFGSPCAGASILEDLYVEDAYGPGFVWSPPPEMPILPPNTDIAMIYPRFIHTTSGSRDEGASPSFIGPVMDLAASWYRLGGNENRLLYKTDDGEHGYGVGRREDTYSWFAYTLFGDTSKHPSESPVRIFTESELEPDISSSMTLVEELESAASRESARRFSAFQPAGDYADRVRKGMAGLFAGYLSRKPKTEVAWKSDLPSLSVTALRVTTSNTSFPVFVFENRAVADSSQALYLPRAGTMKDSSALADIISRYRRVYCVDYMGIGEMRSNSIMLHTLARQFMFNDPSLPRMIVDDLRDFLETLEGPVDLHGSGWASSFFAASLKYLAPERTGGLSMIGVPHNELDYLSSGNKVPDLLLWAGLFSKVTVLEIAAAALDQR